jgi:hypothetical protein
MDFVGAWIEVHTACIVIADDRELMLKYAPQAVTTADKYRLLIQHSLNRRNKQNLTELIKYL